MAQDMTFYWRTDEIPELADLPPEQRRARWREACEHGRPRDNRPMGALVAATVFAVVYVITVVVAPYAWFVDLLVAAAAGLAGAAFQQRWRTQPRARQWLREQGGSGA